MRWLRSLRFDDVCSQAVFVDYLSGVEMLLARRAALTCALEQVIPDSRHAATIARLRCFRGIDTLSAAGLCAEVGDWQRFRPKQLSGFLGIVPTEHTSDTKRRQGSITKGGLEPRPPAAGRSCPPLPPPPRRRRQPGPPPSRPGSPRDRDLLARPATPAPALAGAAPAATQPAGVVAIACARELAAFCWEAATLT
jgi:transposase